MGTYKKQPSETDQNYRTLVQNIKDYAIFMLDKKGRVTSWDQGGVKLFGYKRNEIVGKKFSLLFTPSDIKNGVPNSDMATAVIEYRHLDEREYIRKDKTKFWSSGVLTSTRDKKGRHQGFSKIMRDVTQQNALHKTAVHNSMHDFLTGLPNRNFFEESLIESLRRNKKANLLAVLFMDFNRFKKINDKYGHRVGDLVLIEIAHRLSHNARLPHVTARFGGDEFVILAKQLKDIRAVESFAKKILKAFRVPIEIQKKRVLATVSIGIAVYPTHGKKPGELLRLSDMALYEAKKTGGNQFRIHIPTDKEAK